MSYPSRSLINVLVLIRYLTLDETDTDVPKLDESKTEPAEEKPLEENKQEEEIHTLAKDVEKVKLNKDDSVYLSETETDLVVNNFEDIDINGEEDGEESEGENEHNGGGIHVIKLADDVKYNNGKKVKYFFDNQRAGL